MRELGSGLDAVSVQEVQLGLAAGFKPRLSELSPPFGVSLKEIEEVARSGGSNQY